MRPWLIVSALIFCFFSVEAPAMAQNSGRMDDARLDRLIRSLDGVSRDLKREPGFWLFSYQNHEIYVVTEGDEDRLRILVPILTVVDLDRETLYRTMQANFGSSGLARYGIARDILWSVYIHKFSTLTEKEFVTALQNVATAATDFVTTIELEKPTPGKDIPKDGKS